MVKASIERQEDILFARYLARILAVQNLIVYDYNIRCPVHTAVPDFGGYQFSGVHARVLELTELTPYAECSSSHVMDIGSAIARIIEQGYSTRRRGNNVSVDTFPYTKADWYKHVFWPVHLNGRALPVSAYAISVYAEQAPRDQINETYSGLACKMRSELQHVRGSTYKRNLSSILLYSEVLCSKLNNFEHRTAPPVRLRLKLASPSAWRRIIEPKLKSPIQSQSSSAMATTMSLTYISIHALTSIMASQLEQPQDVRTTVPC
jgi:hypothetical protein